MSLYDDFCKRKNNGEVLDFSKISKEELKILFYDENISDSRIAELFNVKYSQVKYKREKWGVTFKELLFQEALENVPYELNQKSKSRLLSIENLSKLSKAITHFAFRNSPAEDVRANGQFSQEDMKTLNKFMVNRLAYVFKLIIEEKWCELEFLVDKTDEIYGHDWDNVIPDDGGIMEFLKMECNHYK